MSLECLLEAAKIVEQREHNGQFTFCISCTLYNILKEFWSLLCFVLVTEYFHVCNATWPSRMQKPCDFYSMRFHLFTDNHLQFLPIGRKDRKFVKRSQTYRYVIQYIQQFFIVERNYLNDKLFCCCFMGGWCNGAYIFVSHDIQWVLYVVGWVITFSRACCGEKILRSHSLCVGRFDVQSVCCCCVIF